MAELPGWPTERRLRLTLRLVPALLLLGTGGAARVRAQDVPRDEDPRAGVVLEAGVRATSVHGDVEYLVGGAVLFSVSSSFSLGGGGAVLATDHHVSGDPIFPDRTMGFGYGGVVLDLAGPRLGASTDLSVRTLVGAGNVDLTDRVTLARLESDNAFVIEPELSVRREITPWLRLVASVSHRFVLGLDRIDKDATGDLESPSLGLLLRLGPL